MEETKAKNWVDRMAVATWALRLDWEMANLDAIQGQEQGALLETAQILAWAARQARATAQRLDEIEESVLDAYASREAAVKDLVRPGQE